MAQNEVDMTAPSMSEDTITGAASVDETISESTGQEDQHAATDSINDTVQSGGENVPITAPVVNEEAMQTEPAHAESAPQAVAEADPSQRMPDAAAPVAAEPAHAPETAPIEAGSMHTEATTTLEDNGTATAATSTAEQAIKDMTKEASSTDVNIDNANATPAANTFGQDLLSLASSMVPHANPQEDDSTAAGLPVHDVATGGDALETASVVQPQIQSAESNGHETNDTTNGTSASVTVPAAAASATAEGEVQTAEQVPDVSTTHRADSDIEEGEELSSPPRRTSNLEEVGDRESQYQRGSQRSISPGSTRALRSRDGRSRSPGRQRRPSPVRDGQPSKRIYNRDELFKVYIGGLPEKTELLDLQDCFGQFGEIGHIELKTGYAFIEFVTQEGAAEAIETYNEGHFLGKMIKVEASKSATTQQKSIDEGTCFTCGEHGHFAKYCPSDPRNANRGLRRGGRDRSPGRADRRDFRDRDGGRDRPYQPRGERDRGRRDRDDGRDDPRSYRPRDRDDRREPDRRRDRDRDVGAINGGRYIEPQTRDAHRSLARSADPSALRERETLDQQRDRERQLRRLAEMDPNFMPPPPTPVAGYPPRGSMDNASYPPPGAIPPQAGSPYYPPYGAPAFPPPPGALSVGAPYGIPQGIPGSSASPPIPPYPPRGESRMPYNNGGAPFSPNIPPYGREVNNAPGEPYYRASDGPPRDAQNGSYGNRDALRDGYNGSGGGDRYGGPSRPPYPPLGEPPYSRRGEERPPLDSSMPPGGMPPYFYDRPGPGWTGPPGGPDRLAAGSPPFDNYGRGPPQSHHPNGPNHEYDSYRPGR